MSATPWTVGRYVVETLAANGIDTVFGIPGVHNIELRSEEHTSELQSLRHLVCRLLLEKKKKQCNQGPFRPAGRSSRDYFVVGGLGAVGGRAIRPATSPVRQRHHIMLHGRSPRDGSAR